MRGAYARRLSRPMRLERKGSWLIAGERSWQMHSVHGPLESSPSGRELFRVETAQREVLLVSRPVGERGMRELELDSVLPPTQSA